MDNSVYKSIDGKKQIIEFYDNVRSKLEYEYNEIYVDTSYGKTYLFETGDKTKPTIMLFHGSCTNSAMWYSDANALLQDYHVISVDILGEPGKSDENRYDLKSDDYALWINEIVDFLSLDKVILAGNSLGGWMALKYAVRFHERADKVVLIAPSGIVPARLSFVLKSIYYAMKGEEGLKKLGQLITGQDELPKEVIEFNVLVAKHFSPILGGLPVFSDDELKRLTMPVMFTCGENDITMNVKKAVKRLKDNVPHVDIQLIANNEHVVFNIVDEILKFIK